MKLCIAHLSNSAITMGACTSQEKNNEVIKEIPKTTYNEYETPYGRKESEEVDLKKYVEINSIKQLGCNSMEDLTALVNNDIAFFVKWIKQYPIETDFYILLDGDYRIKINHKLYLERLVEGFQKYNTKVKSYKICTQEEWKLKYGKLPVNVSVTDHIKTPVYNMDGIVLESKPVAGEAVLHFIIRG